MLSRNSIRIFRDSENFKTFLYNDVYQNEFQKKNINVTIYGDNMVNKSIYKKLNVKYDFYYVLLDDYETTQAKIDFLKNKQILELLGAEKIVIDREYLANKVISHMIGQGSDTIEHNNTNENSQTNKDLYKYKLTKGFYSSVEDFLRKVDQDKYILLSRQEIMSDFELKSLLGARIEKGLNEFNKIIRISKVSKKEMKLNMVFNPTIGISLGYSKKKKQENFLTQSINYITLTKPEHYIDRFCSDLELRSEAIVLCHQWMKEIKRLELDSGRGPVGIAAALIYMASIVTGQNRTQREIADITNVTEVTIRNRYKELSKALNVEVSV